VERKSQVSLDTRGVRHELRGLAETLERFFIPILQAQFDARAYERFDLFGLCAHRNGREREQ
jgi:hypothetical protein